jgi:AcrR family transcriptional regulator
VSTDVPEHRSKTPRAEGMRSFVDATVTLLRQHPPEEITVRQIAEGAGHSHRFIGEWFGGKADLYRAALEALIAQAAPAATPLRADRIQPDIRTAIHVLAWLRSNEPAVLEGFTLAPIADTIAERYLGVGIEPDVAKLLARRVIAMAISFELFGDAISFDDASIKHQTSLEQRIVSLLVG